MARDVSSIGADLGEDQEASEEAHNEEAFNEFLDKLNTDQDLKDLGYSNLSPDDPRREEVRAELYQVFKLSEKAKDVIPAMLESVLEEDLSKVGMSLELKDADKDKIVKYFIKEGLDQNKRDRVLEILDRVAEQQQVRAENAKKESALNKLINKRFRNKPGYTVESKQKFLDMMTEAKKALPTGLKRLWPGNWLRSEEQADLIKRLDVKFGVNLSVIDEEIAFMQEHIKQHEDLQEIKNGAQEARHALLSNIAVIEDIFKGPGGIRETVAKQFKDLAEGNAAAGLTAKPREAIAALNRFKGTKDASGAEKTKGIEKKNAPMPADAIVSGGKTEFSVDYLGKSTVDQKKLRDSLQAEVKAKVVAKLNSPDVKKGNAVNELISAFDEIIGYEADAPETREQLMKVLKEEWKTMADKTKKALVADVINKLNKRAAKS
ncbi:MAG: hypothetical protein Q7K39_04170 [Candidatus Magasanikbacteria bacterium]|nr:hypothetical protein [Candidatus Magasanikbacteria bacterium]